MYVFILRAYPYNQVSLLVRILRVYICWMIREASRNVFNRFILQKLALTRLGNLLYNMYIFYESLLFSRDFHAS